jgi:hypothetical protein
MNKESDVLKHKLRHKDKKKNRKKEGETNMKIKIREHTGQIMQ